MGSGREKGGRTGFCKQVGVKTKQGFLPGIRVWKVSPGEPRVLECGGSGSRAPPQPRGERESMGIWLFLVTEN